MTRTTRTSQRAASSTSKTFLKYVVDTSGSMTHLSSAVELGIKSFVEDQIKIAKDEGRLNTTNFTLVEFNTNKKTIYDGPINNFTGYEMICEGLTRLYDTVSEEVQTLVDNIKQSKEVTNLGIPPPKAVFVIMTDGHNNQGTYTSGEMRNHIENARKKGVICTFMGANQDACENGVNYGFSPDASLTFTPNPRTTIAAMHAVSSGTHRALSQPNGGDIVYSQIERQQSQITQYDDPHIYESPKRQTDITKNQIMDADDIFEPRKRRRT